MNARLVCPDDLREVELRDILRMMTHWGFAVMQPVHHHSPGFRVLAVAMRTVPTRAHFDPEVLAMPVVGFGQLANRVKWQRDSHFVPPVQVLPGAICITDRLNKQVNFYSYGGALQTVREDGNCTIFVMSSSAPILSLGTQVAFAVEDQLATATEALLARLRATAHCQGKELAPRLAQLSPLARYAGCVTSLVAQYQASPFGSRTYPEFCRLLKREAAWLSEQSGIQMLPLEQLVEIAPAAPMRV